MNSEAQRIAIAEVCGWVKVPNVRGKRWCRHYLCLGPHHSLGSLPDYLNDLNACHEMEATLNQDRMDAMGSLLQHMTGDVEFHATPAQRCEAFLRILKLWTD